MKLLALTLFRIGWLAVPQSRIGSHTVHYRLPNCYHIRGLLVAKLFFNSRPIGCETVPLFKAYWFPYWLPGLWLANIDGLTLFTFQYGLNFWVHFEKIINEYPVLNLSYKSSWIDLLFLYDLAQYWHNCRSSLLFLVTLISTILAQLSIKPTVLDDLAQYWHNCPSSLLFLMTLDNIGTTLHQAYCSWWPCRKFWHNCPSSLLFLVTCCWCEFLIKQIGWKMKLDDVFIPTSK